MSARPTGCYVLNPDAYDLIYGPDERAAIAARVDLVGPPLTAADLQADPSRLADVDLIFSGWGMVPLDAAILAHAPRLAAVFYGAGTIRYFSTDAMWDRGVVVTSAYAGNAVPVVEFTVAEIVLSLKRVWHYARTVRDLRAYPEGRHGVPGAYGTTVGLIALGTIGRQVAERLAAFDVQVLAHDPFVDAATAAALGVEMVSLAELFRRSQVVSLHAPWLPETVGMITGEHLAALPPDATFINTARGHRARAGDDRRAAPTPRCVCRAGCDLPGAARRRFAAVHAAQCGADAASGRVAGPRVSAHGADDGGGTGTVSRRGAAALGDQSRRGRTHGLADANAYVNALSLPESRTKIQVELVASTI